MAPAPRCRISPAVLALLLALAAPARAAITIGPGPAIGTDRAGVTWYEEFQDWTHADLKALDPAGAADATYSYGDGLDDSRDLVAFYEREEGSHVYFRADFYDLALGAETNGVNLYIAIDCASGGQLWMPDFVNVQTDHPWELCLCIYQSGTSSGTDYRIYDQNFNPVSGGYLGSYWNSQLDAVELGIDRQLLLNAGWNGTTPLQFQVFTTKDGAGASSCPSGSKVADCFIDSDRGCSDGVLNGAISSTDSPGVVYYASIAHGNQSVNRAGDIGAHIYDTQANTGISGGTGFLRTLDTHSMFKVPLNIHPSGTLTTACLWAKKPGGASDPQDGPSFLSRVRGFVDPDQSNDPGALIGGVYAEHIMPYFEGAANAASIAMTDSLNQVVYGVSAAQSQVMHVPERVIRSLDTGYAPLTGHTFADIAASPYAATYLDEVTHLHAWFYPNENCADDYGYRHKVHRINGVYCFMINDREDQEKFGNWDGGMVMDSRYSLLQKALYGSSSEIVVVFDDWEALAGKSFDPVSGNSVPNNNPNQYHATIRWAANHPWIRISTLKDLLGLALANPSAFVIDHGTRYDLPLETYEYLMHSTEDSYDSWYYANHNGNPTAEQDFYALVPVISGPQGDYHTRGVGTGSDGPGLPGGRANGDMNSSGTLIHDTWATLQAAPAGRLRDLGIASFETMIYETAWHEEDNTNYANSCYGPWQYPDQTWDGVNTWALRLSNHVRWAGVYAAAAAWADSVRSGLLRQAANPMAYAADLDEDGENEYVLRDGRVFAVFERYGGRCVLACAWSQGRNDAEVLVGAPLTNPSAPGEEELTGSSANRCSGFKVMNGGTRADEAAAVTTANLMDPQLGIPADGIVRAGWTFTSPDGQLVKTVWIQPIDPTLHAYLGGSLSGPVYVRTGLSPNPLDLMRYGQGHLSATNPSSTSYQLVNTSGGLARLDWAAGVAFNAMPSDESADRRNLALTEEVELSGNLPFGFTLTLSGDTTPLPVNGVPRAAAVPVAFAVSSPAPSPARGGARFAISLPERRSVRWQLVDVAGRAVAGTDLGVREAGTFDVALDAASTPAPGLYFVRVTAGAETQSRRWAVVR
jgi:hypothetical protein